MSGTSGPTVKRLIQTSLSFTVPPKKSAVTTSTMVSRMYFKQHFGIWLTSDRRIINVQRIVLFCTLLRLLD